MKCFKDAFVATLIAGLVASGCVNRTAPTMIPTIVPTAELPSAQTTAPVVVSAGPTQSACIEGQPHTIAGAESFEGTCFGWRVGAEDYLGGDRDDRNLQIDCEPELFGYSLETSGPPAVDHHTDLDIEFVSVPVGATVEHYDKWACGSLGLSDHLGLRFELGGMVDIARWLQGTAWLVVNARPGSVASCDILGVPAVCIDNVSGTDFAFVFVLEDAVLDPHGVVLRLYSEELTLAELRQVAESIIGA